MGEIYKLTFPSGKSYIGLTKGSSMKRFQFHKYSASDNKRKTPLYNYWRKHGAPEILVLAIVDNSQLFETEIRAIAAYGTLVPNGLNCSLGGEMGPLLTAEVLAKMGAMKGRKHSDESKAKMSKSQAGIKRHALSAVKKGKPISESVKIKLSESQKKRLADPVNKAALLANLAPHRMANEKLKANPRKGWTHDADARKKIGDAHRGRKNPHAGHKWTEEQKRKISESLKARRAK